MAKALERMGLEELDAELAKADKVQTDAAMRKRDIGLERQRRLTSERAGADVEALSQAERDAQLAALIDAMPDSPEKRTMRESHDRALEASGSAVATVNTLRVAPTPQEGEARG